ncbi:unnamed protein product [Diatraea saccharalis]|uniref:Uncharacterized protein n=1 Tax=Diatraea saccharalis TaxID=40085 RepID=A0A9N9RCL6_9NEOP|nr:unnamed protein product [Diatraea saccharalis]
MKKFTIIWLALYGNCLVSGIPINQIIPSQTCPHNPITYHQPVNIPLLLRQENIPQSIFDIYQQPNNNNFYPPQVLTQNELTTPCQQNVNYPNSGYQIPVNQQIDPIANQISQLYMNKILSNPMVQEILDSNSRMYNTAVLEIPNQMFNNIATQGNVPHVVNNYFILPSELLNINEDIDSLKRIQNQAKHNDGRPRHNVNRRRKSNKEATDNKYSGNVQRRQLDRNGNHRSEKIRSGGDYNKKGHQNYDDQKCASNRKKNKNVSIENENRDHKERKRESRPKGRGQHYNNHRDQPSLIKQEPPKIVIRLKDIDKVHGDEQYPKSSHIVPQSTEVIETNKRKNNNWNPKDDAIIEEFKIKFPGIPEEVVRSLLAYLRHQLQKQQLGQSPFYYPDVTFPLQFEQLFPHMKWSNTNIHESYDHKKRRPNRRNSNQKTNQNQKTKPVNVVKIDNTIPESITIDTTTLNTEITTLNYQEPTTEDILETTTNVLITPELGTEDVVVDVNNRLIDDYYPDFTNDKTYFDSEEVQFVRNHRDNRYYYTTARNINDEIKKGDNVENVLMKPTTDNDSETEITVFRTPPLLEIPNFKTKQISKGKPINNHHKDKGFDKFSTYSDAKMPPTKDLKHNHKLEKSKKTKPDIETVFAHSKVVKYGRTDEVDEENETSFVTYYLPANMQYEDDGKTVIVAKSIPEDYFW